MAIAPLPRTLTDLPVEHHVEGIAKAVAGGSLVLTAEPGAGKTSIVPLVVAAAVEGRVLVLQPRRLAARAAAQRLTDLVPDGGDLGATVGLTMRGERKVGPTTRIEVMTEAVLTNRLQRDPELTGVGAIVFDEFHERNLHSDLGLAMAIEVRATIRPDLALIVMSATLDVDPVAELLRADSATGSTTDSATDSATGGATVIAVEGRTFPVTTIHLDRPPRRRWADAVAATTRRALAEVAGDVLVFVPGRGEINQVSSRLAGCGAEVVELHGGVPASARDRVLRPGSGRRVVVATAVAETSVTLPAIEAVVDGGLARHARFDPETGLGRLETLHVTRFSADQRRGRAGRLSPGVCYRLWSEAEHHHLDVAIVPEITAGDPVPVAFELARWGDPHAQSLPLLDHPGPERLAAGQHMLAGLGLLDDDARLSERGRTQARLGVHPRTGALLLVALDRNEEALGALVGAALEDERHATTTDLLAEVEQRQRELQPAAARLLDRLLGGTGRRGRRPGTRRNRDHLAMEGQLGQLGPLLASAWPDRLAMARQGRPGSFLMANGREAAVDERDPLARAEFLIVVEADGKRPTATIRRAVAIDRATLLVAAAEHIQWFDDVRWDDRRGAVRAERQRRLGALVLHAEPLAKPPSELTAMALADGVARRGLNLLRWSDAALANRQRLAWLHEQAPDAWPAVDDEALIGHARRWIADAGCRHLDDVRRINVATHLLDGLDWRQRADLDRLAPTALDLPSGRSRSIRYDSGRPVWAMRIQDVMGLDVHPTIGPRATPLTIELLSPANRPAQVTTDLPGFWRGTYAAVRTDLRGRYPKHRWPERPWDASERG